MAGEDSMTFTEIQIKPQMQMQMQNADVRHERRERLLSTQAQDRPEDVHTSKRRKKSITL